MKKTRGYFKSRGSLLLRGLTAAVVAVSMGLLPVAPAKIVHATSPSITLFGDYTLTSDMTFSGTGFIIGANGITLDLGGHTISGTIGIGVSVFAHNGVTIKNGTIQGFSNGVNLNGSDANTIEDIVVINSGSTGIGLFDDSDNNHVTNVRSANNGVASGGFGININNGSDGNIVEGSTISGNGGTGIFIGGGGAPGFDAPSPGNQINNNTVDENRTSGVFVRNSNSNVLDGNTVTGSGGTGILIVSSNETRVINNTSYGNASFGIQVNSSGSNPPDNNTLIGNTAFSNSSNSTVSDLFDGTSGNGTRTATTKNTWTNNLGVKAFPAGIVAAPPVLPGARYYMVDAGPVGALGSKLFSMSLESGTANTSILNLLTDALPPAVGGLAAKLDGSNDLYFTTLGPITSTDPDKLYHYTGAGSPPWALIGSITAGGAGLRGVGAGVAFSPDGTLYITGNTTGSNASLYTLNTDTAEATLVGAINAGPTPVNVFGGDITFAPDGRLYLWTNQGGGAFASAGLYELGLPAIGGPTVNATLKRSSLGNAFTGLAARASRDVIGSRFTDDNITIANPFISNIATFGPTYLGGSVFNFVGVGDLSTGNSAPTVSAGGAYTVAEGSTVTLLATGADANGDPLKYAWDLDNDGTFETPGRVTSFTGVDGPAVFTVSVNATDVWGASAAATTTVSVTNSAPSDLFLMPQTPVYEGMAGELMGSFTDPSIHDQWAVQIDWGDGQTETTFNVFASPPPPHFFAFHTYTDDNPSGTPGDAYSVVVTVTDEDGGRTTASALVFVLNAPPSVDAGPDADVAEGSAFSSSGSLTDPGADTWTATVDYGDGSPTIPLPLTGRDFNLNHVYQDNGSYTVTVTVTDDDLGAGSDTALVTVNNFAPAADAGPDKAISEGSAFLSSGSFTDPGADSWTATVDYGNGGGPVALTLNPDKTFFLNHVYPDNGSYPVTVTVDDHDGGTVSDAATVTVTNVAPAADAGPDKGVVEGTAFSSSGSFTDPGADTWTATVNYGDGSGTVPLALAGNDFNLSHVYTVPGSYTVKVTVNDDDLGTDSDTATVEVTARHFIFSSAASSVWVGLKNNDEAGAKFDLKAEVYNGTQLVGSGEALGVSAGSSGFNNAKLNAISITPVPGAYFLSGDTLSLKVLARKSGTRYNPTARLWYDGNATHGDSSFDATIDGSTTTYYLRSGSTLDTVPGTGNPGVFVDVGPLPTGGAYQSFGSWSTTLTLPYATSSSYWPSSERGFSPPSGLFARIRDLLANWSGAHR